MSDQTPTVVADLGVEPDGYVGIVSTVLDIDDTPCEHGCTCPPRLPLPPGMYVVVSADEALYRWNPDTAIEEVWAVIRVESLRQDLIRDGVLVQVYPKKSDDD